MLKSKSQSFRRIHNFLCTTINFMKSSSSRAVGRGSCWGVPRCEWRHRAGEAPRKNFKIGEERGFQTPKKPPLPTALNVATYLWKIGIFYVEVYVFFLLGSLCCIANERKFHQLLMFKLHWHDHSLGTSDVNKKHMYSLPLRLASGRLSTLSLLLSVFHIPYLC